jgi:hypothetical protein
MLSHSRLPLPAYIMQLHSEQLDAGQAHQREPGGKVPTLCGEGFCLFPPASDLQSFGSKLECRKVAGRAGNTSQR